MAELDQIMRALRNAHATGDTSAAKRLAQMAREAQGSGGPAQGATSETIDPVAAAATGRPAPELPADLYSGANAGMFPQDGQSSEPVNVMDPVQGDPTGASAVVDRVRDNVIGTDNGVMSAGEQIAAALNKGGESMTLGVVGDEAAGMADEAIGRRPQGTGIDFYRQQERDLWQNNPALSVGADVGGALAVPGVGAAKFVARGANRGAQAFRSAMVGAGGAATYGAMEGEGGLAERAADGATAAPIGALFGAAGPKIAEAITGLPRRLQVLFRRTEERPTVENLRTVKNAAYEAVEASGEVFSPEDMQGLQQRVTQAFSDSNYVGEVDNASRAVLRNLERRAGQATTLPQLDRLRQDMWSRYRGAQDQPRILDAISAVDDLIATRAGSSELMQAARLANSRYAKSQLIEDAFTRATDQTASTGSGGNILNKYRQAVTSIINNPRKARFFSEGEIDLMRGFVRGTTDENVMRLIGKLSPSGNGLMMALHTIGGVASGGMSVPLMAVGAAAKRSADSSVARRANTMQNVISGAQPNLGLVPLSGPGVALGVSGSGTAADGSQEIRNMLRQIP